MLTSSAAELDSPPPIGTDDTMTTSKDTCGPNMRRIKSLFSLDERYIKVTGFVVLAVTSCK